MNYYPHHIGDFRSGTFNMTRQERWIYRDMIEVYYDTEKPFPDSLDAICKLMGIRREEDREMVAAILLLKFVLKDTGYHHERCDAEIAAYHAKAETAKNNGKKGGRPPKNNPEKPIGLSIGSDPVAIGLAVGTQQKPDGNQEITGSKANQEPRTKNHKPKDQTEGADAPAGSADLVDQAQAQDVAKAPAKFDAKAALIAEGVDAQQAADFLQIRKAKKAPLTQTALDGIKREAEKAGLVLAAAVELCCLRGWQGFKAEWVTEHRGAARATNRPSINDFGAGDDDADDPFNQFRRA